MVVQVMRFKTARKRPFSAEDSGLHLLIEEGDSLLPGVVDHRLIAANQGPVKPVPHRVGVKLMDEVLRGQNLVEQRGVAKQQAPVAMTRLLLTAEISPRAFEGPPARSVNCHCRPAHGTAALLRWGRAAEQLRAAIADPRINRWQVCCPRSS